MKKKGSLFKKEGFEKLKKQIKSFWNRWASLIALEIALYFIIMYMHWQVSGYDNIALKMHYVMIAFDANVLVLLYALMPFKSGKWMGIPMFFAIIYTLGNVLFARYINGYMPINAWLEYENLNGLSDSIIYGLKWTDFVLIALAAAFVIWNDKTHKNYPMYKERLKVMGGVTLFLCFMAVRGTGFFLPQKTGSSDISSDTAVVKGVQS